MIAAAIMVLLASLAEAAICVPGRQLLCACPGGVSGAQRCQEDGAAFGECQCAAAASPMPAAALEAAAANASLFAFVLGGGMALDRPAAAISVGARYRFDSSWAAGADLELNPWASLELKRVRGGTINTYASIIRRFPVTDRVAVRTIASLGFSTLLISLVGAPAGTTGIYAGLSLLGVELRLTRGLRLMLDPAYVAVPVPHITGVPIIYQQYRFEVSLQLDL